MEPAGTSPLALPMKHPLPSLIQQGQRGRRLGWWPPPPPQPAAGIGSLRESESCARGVYMSRCQVPHLWWPDPVLRIFFGKGEKRIIDGIYDWCCFPPPPKKNYVKHRLFSRRAWLGGRRIGQHHLNKDAVRRVGGPMDTSTLNHGRFFLGGRGLASLAPFL